MYITTSTISLKVSQEFKTVLVKYLYLSCDPYMPGFMNNKQYHLFYFFSTNSVHILHIIIYFLISKKIQIKVIEFPTLIEFLYTNTELRVANTID